MKLDPGMHIGTHLVFFGKAGVTDRTSGPFPKGAEGDPGCRGIA
jgi:hypothetical protein